MSRRSVCRMIAPLVLAGMCSILPGGCPLGQPGDDLAAAARGQSNFQGPRLNSPRQSDNVYETNVRLSWTFVSGATAYDVYFGVDTNPPLMVTTTETSVVLREVPRCTEHYWRVVARGDETQAASSATWRFRTRCLD